MAVLMLRVEIDADRLTELLRDLDRYLEMTRPDGIWRFSTGDAIPDVIETASPLA